MSESLSSTDASRFRSAANSYCMLLNERAPVPPAVWAQRVQLALAQLYAAGLSLADIEPDTSLVETAPLDAGTFRERQGTIAALLGRWDIYSSVFDPYDDSDAEVLTGSLALDLAEIHSDVSRALRFEVTAAAATPQDVLWSWRFDFQSHWGRHAIVAMNALHMALQFHYAAALPESFGQPIQSVPPAL